MQEVPTGVSITEIQQRFELRSTAVGNDIDTAYTEIIDDDMHSLGKPL
jgi:hypothetical protein